MLLLYDNILLWVSNKNIISSYQICYFLDLPIMISFPFIEIEHDALSKTVLLTKNKVISVTRMGAWKLCGHFYVRVYCSFKEITFIRRL